MSTPTRADVKVGHWVVIRDHWVVGPIFPPKYPEEALAYAMQCALADEIMEEIIAEENIDKIIRIPSHACS